MPRRFLRYMGQPDTVRWSDYPGIAIAFGVALLLGMVSGTIWIGWSLFKIHVLGIQP